MRSAYPLSLLRHAGTRCLAGLLSFCLAVPPASAMLLQDAPASTKSDSTARKHKPAKKPAHKSSASSRTQSAKKTVKARRGSSHRKRGRTSAKAQRIRKAFVASAELRPMAQQLITLRSPAAYEGVSAYARKHTGDAAATAYLALGYASMLDQKYADAIEDFEHARHAGDALDDYAVFFEARSALLSNNFETAEKLLHDYTTRFPESIFNAQVPELEVSALLGLKQPQQAQAVLAAAQSAAAAGRPGFQFARAQVADALNQKSVAIDLYKQLLVKSPLTSQAAIARDRLKSSGADSTLSVAELRSLADAYYKAGRYIEAEDEYHTLANRADVDVDTRDSFMVAAAACNWKLKKLTTADAEVLPDTQDENGARRVYLLMELARDRTDADAQQALVTQMQTRFPNSPWLAEALFSSGNMYLLRRDYAKAIQYYGTLADRFPDSKNAAAAHWRAGWLSYRQAQYADAARLFDDQIKRYPDAAETAAALYWRGRLYESQDHNPARAAANYRAVVRAYEHYYYAQMARQRLSALGSLQTVDAPSLDQFQAPPPPALDDTFPEDSEHLAKAKLLANAGLNEFIGDEIAADPDSKNWSALAEAQIYASYGETYRALRALKRAIPSAASASFKSIPYAYWRILFPEPYWSTIKTESAKNNLDPYLVASLIRQESEFNPSVVSYANAYGLMQLLPSVGKAMAKQEGIAHFQTFQLLDPDTNIRLGTRYLRQMLDRLGGVTEYALAAYNAGDSRVTDWRDSGQYGGMDEFVESIPFTQTREYVQAILRNVEIYKGLSGADDQAVVAEGDRSSMR